MESTTELTYQSTCERSGCTEHVFYRLGKLCFSHLIENQTPINGLCNFPDEDGELCFSPLDDVRFSICTDCDFFVSANYIDLFGDSDEPYVDEYGHEYPFEFEPEAEFFPNFMCEMLMNGVKHQCKYMRHIQSIKGNCCIDYDHV